MENYKVGEWCAVCWGGNGDETRSEWTNSVFTFSTHKNHFHLLLSRSLRWKDGKFSLVSSPECFHFIVPVAVKSYQRETDAGCSDGNIARIKIRKLKCRRSLSCWMPFCVYFPTKVYLSSISTVNFHVWQNIVHIFSLCYWCWILVTSHHFLFTIIHFTFFFCSNVASHLIHSPFYHSCISLTCLHFETMTTTL